MSLYNMLNGVAPPTFFIMPMLGLHPDDVPRFRDCFIGDEDYPEYNGYIHVYTRVGSLNKNCGFGEEKLYEHPNFTAYFDDKEDPTYGTYVFSIPEKWQKEFNNIVKEGKLFLNHISEEYKQQIYEIFPNLKEKFEKLFINMEKTEKNDV